MILNSLSSRIIVFFSILFATVLILVLVLVTVFSRQIAVQQNNQELAVDARVFQLLLTQNQSQLIQGAKVLAADFGFREAIASKDLATIHSALENQGRRLNADIMLLVSLDGRLIASTPDVADIDRNKPFMNLVSGAETYGSASGVMRDHDDLYQVAVVPVFSPEPVAWIAPGFVINNEFAEYLQLLTSMQVSFLARNVDQWEILASTQPAEIQANLLNSISDLHHLQADSGPLLMGDFASLISPLGDGGEMEFAALLQRSFSGAVARFQPLRTILTILTIISLLAIIIGSFFITRRITNPIKQLIGIAQSIKDGDYSRNVRLSSYNEIGELAASFNHMSEAISFRESEIRRLAYEDKVTGLPNRAMFNNYLDRHIRMSARAGGEFSVLLLNINRFSIINDTLGYIAGDNVLKLVANRLPSAVRDADTIACLGGDEFAIMLTTGKEKQIEAVIDRFNRLIKVPFTVNDQSIDISCTIGVAVYPVHGADSISLLRHANIAMNNAKKIRTDFAIYDVEYDQIRQEHLHLVGDLDRAVERNELQLYFQPKLDLSSDKVSSVECLIRWIHPERGVVPPNDFIPFAEQTGAIRKLTRWVIENAIRQCSAWHAKGIFVNVSLNISARDLIDRRLPEFIAGKLDEHKMPAEHVCLEITESGLMDDPLNAQQILNHLHMIGLKLAIDDYGTGYSSLAYIKDLPVDELKIDRAFIRNITQKSVDYSIVQSTVELGHNLGLTVVAEGVESLEELNLLKSLGCDQIQGYYIARPLAAEAFEAWYREKNPSSAGAVVGMRFRN